MDDDRQETDVVMRVLRHPAMLLVLAIITAFFGEGAVGALAYLLSPKLNDFAAILVGVLAAAIFIALYVFFCRVVEGRPARELSLHGAARELGLGIIVGLVLFSLIVAVIAALGGYRVIGYHGPTVLLPVIGISILSGFTEEIMFRGWFFRLVEQWLGSAAALISSAALFGALHLGNPNATAFAAAAIAIEAGIMLAAIYMITRRLWAAIGVHMAWNFAQGGIFGIPVSGGAMDGILRPEIRGPTLLTGGLFGAEASLPAIIVATTFGIGLLVIAARRGQIMPPRWIRLRQGAAVGVQE